MENNYKDISRKNLIKWIESQKEQIAALEETVDKSNTYIDNMFKNSDKMANKILKANTNLTYLKELVSQIASVIFFVNERISIIENVLKEEK